VVGSNEGRSLGHGILRKIVELRDKQGLSRKNLGDLSGVAETYLEQIEIGEKVPTIDTLKQIADGLGVPVSELVSKKR
jgi:transcriptional regulator with XRE-family HTH domain